jgi:hypothetical protein
MKRLIKTMMFSIKSDDVQALLDKLDTLKCILDYEFIATVEEEEIDED